jgi:hypothetical protein
MTDLWAYIDEAGRILADSTFTDESEAWRVALGWPADAEVVEAKARGCRVVRVRIAEVANDDG